MAKSCSTVITVSKGCERGKGAMQNKSSIKNVIGARTLVSTPLVYLPFHPCNCNRDG
jgi:hypothetical protein